MLFEKIDQDLKQAMKDKEELVLSTLRMAKSALKNKQIDSQKELTDDDVIAVLKTMVKQYKDALADFTSSGRQDLADRQNSEIAVLERYLPAAMSESDLEAICKRIISEQNATLKDLGKIMGSVMKEIGGSADGNTVRAIVQKLLTS
jgi:uncharacterized protein YqeY